MSLMGQQPWGYQPQLQQAQQSYLAPQMNPNQQLAAQAGMGSRAFYSPFNSPYSGMRTPGPEYDRMPQQSMGMGPDAKAGGQQAPTQQWSSQGMQAPQNPSIGLSAIVNQMQGGLGNIAARQQLGALAGVPQMGPGIGASQPQFQQMPWSPTQREGYRQSMGNVGAMLPAIQGLQGQVAQLGQPTKPPPGPIGPPRFTTNV
jgi:hypothetical protein